MPLVKKTLAVRPLETGTELPEATARLRSGRAEDRWETARQLAEFPAAVPALSKLLDGEGDERVREAALTSLAKINSAASFDAVLLRLRVDDASLRTAALDALKLMPEMTGLRLDVLLADADADIRVLACDLARVAAPVVAQKSLAAILPTEPEINVCAAAIDLLAEIGTPEILPAMEQCAQRFASPFLNFSVQMASAQITARSAQPRA